MLERRLGDGPDYRVDGRAVLENHERRDRLDLVFRRDCRMLVDVHLPEGHAPSELRGQPFDYGLHRPARAAPHSPEVDERGLPAVYLPVEVPFRQLQYLTMLIF